MRFGCVLKERLVGFIDGCNGGVRKIELGMIIKCLVWVMRGKVVGGINWKLGGCSDLGV